MKIERHYECVEDYLANRRDERVTIYEVYMYGEDNLDLWYFSSLEPAKRSLSNLKKVGLCEDSYIKELQCYVDKVGIVWIEYIHTIND